MSPGLEVAVVAGAALCAVLLVALAAVLLRGTRRRRALAAELDATRDRLEQLQDRFDDLVREVRRPASSGQKPDEAAEADYVITTAELPPVPSAPTAIVEPLTAREFASVALGESLVRVVSLGYGVRRALTAENRNRIGFEMRREVRRARKERRRELKLVRRGLRNGDARSAGRDAAA